MSESLPAEDPKPTTEDWLAAIRYDAAIHFTACTQIRDKANDLIQPKPNALQTQLFEAYRYLDDRCLPINLIVLKPRQSGGSEGTAQLCYFHSRKYCLSGLMMADQHKRTDKIWELFCNKADHDTFELQWGNRMRTNTEKATLHWVDEKGRNRKALWERDTALDPKAGASGTRQILWFSEAARYAKEGKFRDSEVIGNALSSIPPNQPHTMRIMESTAEGSGGHFANTFEKAVYLHEREAGRVGNGWLRVFVAWHECDDYALDPSNPANAEYFDDGNPEWVRFAEEEEAGRIRYGWTPEQIAWSRWKIMSECNGDRALFKRDFPASPEEAWSSSGSKRFSVVALAYMLKAATVSWEATLKGLPNAPKLGSLMAQGGTESVVWLPAREDAWLWCAEQPEYGRRYLMAVDPMTGEQSAGSDQRDNHAVLVIRAEYEQDGEVHPAEMVAAVWQPNGCQWDMDVLADRISLLSRWYGKCIVVNEVNKAMDLVPLLQARGVPMYRRKARPDVLNPSERQTIVGFYTDTSTRQMWVTAAAEAIRESTVWCLFLPAVKEMDTFIVNSKGKAEAAPGTHDDWVAAFGIGCLTRNGATAMGLPSVRTPQQTGARQWGQTGGQYARLGTGALS